MPRRFQSESDAVVHASGDGVNLGGVVEQKPFDRSFVWRENLRVVHLIQRVGIGCTENVDARDR